MKRVLLLATMGVFFCLPLIKAQNVFNPADPIIRWNSTQPLGSPQNPNPNIAGVQKWVSVASSGVSGGPNSFDASSFKAYFINSGGFKMAFRIKFPKSYTNPDSINKVYPAMLFFHGAGEPGCPGNGGVYNNERQLLHGGNLFRQGVDNGAFDGFLVYPQAVVTSGCWSDWGIAPYSPAYVLAIAMLDSLGRHARLDIDRVFLNGLSNGGGAAFSMTAVYPQRVTKIGPSAAATGHTNYADYVHIPIWFATGENDSNPSPGFAGGVYNAIKNAGSDIKWTLYPGLGHAIWYVHWEEPGYFPYMNDMHKASPLVYFQRYEYCLGETINAKIGVTRGYYEYEWRKGTTTIATATATSVPTNPPTNTNLTYSYNIIDPSSIVDFIGNDITVNSYGSYSVRFKRTASSNWSVWSPKPAVIAQKVTTQTPPIQITGIKSKVLPALDGSTTVPLELPAGYFGYEWYRVSDNALVSTQRTYVAPVGVYKAKVLEQFGCGASFSPNFTVINASGSPKPDPAKNLSAIAVSQASIQLDWNENPNAGQNETGFEIYRSNSQNGAYQLLNITAPNVVSYLDAGLTSNTVYYYIIRAVGDFGAAANSNQATAQTLADITAPTTPSGLVVTCTGRTFVSLKWNASTDNVGVFKYDIYVNGTKLYTSSQTSFTVNALTEFQTYNFTVKARDAAGNISGVSNQATASTYLQGLCYRYFHGTWDLLPDFNATQMFKNGVTPNVDISVRDQNDNFGFVWEGQIKIPTAGTYEFYTNSDEGSKLYIGAYNHNGIPVVNNDGLHGPIEATGTYDFPQAGVYPIAISYFDRSGNQQILVSWQGPGIPKQQIPNSAFNDSYAFPGTVPSRPGDVTATAVAFDQINLSWTDNSSDETGFEIARATGAGTFATVATVGAGITSYNDVGLSASTLYRYKVRAINNFGGSAYAGASTLAHWGGNNVFTDDVNPSHNLVPPGGTSTPTFSSTEKREGSHSFRFDGNDYADINETSGGGWLGGSYTQRTVGVWIKAASYNVLSRIIWEIGGADAGLGLAYSGNLLVAGVASNNQRTYVLSPYHSLDWNYVEVVYYQNSLRLFINGAEVASQTLPFSSISASTNDSRVGASSSSNVFGAPPANTNFFGNIDGLIIYTDVSATTLGPPAPPTAPGNLSAQAISTQVINLSWNDLSSNETGFEIWRSVANNTNYRLIATQGANTSSYSDVALFANVTYYYKIRAIGTGSPSAFTGEVNATTLNTVPVITNIRDFTMQYNTSYTLPINAIDVDNDALSFTAENLPSFATIQNVSNGNANIIFNPTIADPGVYVITIFVSDGHSGADTAFFTMVINDNAVPTLNAIADVSMDEGGDVLIPVSANDAEGNNNFQWSFPGKPSFATFTNNGNGTGSIRLLPGYASSGIYTMTVIANDGYGAWASRTFTITVLEKDPNEKIQINFRYSTGSVPLWNDVTAPFTFNNLLNTKNISTTVDISVQSGSPAAGYPGQVTGNNSGVYPDNIIADYMKWGNDGAADVVVLKISQLDVTKKYNFIFFASDACNYCFLDVNSTVTYQIGSEIASIKYYLNTTETDTIYQVQPNAAGEVFITMTGDPRTYMGGVLNALVIDAQYNDGTTPVKPLNLTGQHIQNSGVKLSWIDRSYNELTYKVYRATNIAGPYTLLNPGDDNADDTTYLDLTGLPFTQYYYYVRGSNNIGDGIPSDTISVTTGNNLPSINSLDNIFLNSDATAQEDFSVVDDAGDVVTVSIPNIPPFVTLTHLGGTNYRITAAPTIDNLGWFNLAVTATDDKGGVRTKMMTISVTDKNTRSVFVNMGSFGKTAPQPWNNFLGGGAGNFKLNLLDENNAPTTIDIQMINGWSGGTLLGHITGNNSGVVIDSVLASGVWDNGSTPRQITISGLDDSKQYNLVFVGSQNEGIDASTQYAVGAQSVVLNARNNTNQTANINGLTPTSGSLTIEVTRLPSAAYMYLNAIIIEEYTDPSTVLNPINLYVEPLDRTTVSLSWSDRSNLETGYELERATNAAFTGATIISLPANSTSYTNSGLTPNTKYWFRVKATTGTSGYSNAVVTITPESIVYVNFNFAVPPAPAPWNNTLALPNFFNTFSNLTNHAGIISGITLSIEKLFNGEFNAGDTASNTGIVPDNVLMSNYWLDNRQLSQMRVSGLNQSKRYRFGFIGSAGPQGWFPGNYTATYTINGRTVYLNAWQNTTKIVYIGDVLPDVNGEVLLNFSTTDAATFGFNAGVLIEGYDDPVGGTVLNRPNFGDDVDQLVQQWNDQSSIQGNDVRAKIYPNPFIDFVNIDFNNTSANNRISVEVHDLTGRMVYRRSYTGVPQGYNTLRLNTAEGGLNTGVYLFTLNINGRPVQAGKMIKTLE